MATDLENMTAFKNALDTYGVEYRNASFGIELAIMVKAPMSNTSNVEVMTIFRQDGRAMDFITAPLKNLGASMLGAMSCCNSLNSGRSFPGYSIDGNGNLIAQAVAFLPEEPNENLMFGAFVNFFNDIDMSWPIIQNQLDQ